MKKKDVKTLAIIPARGGSKGIPRKNVVKLGGKPLIYYSIRAAKQSKLLDAFLVSTDDPKIAEVARRYGAPVPFLRPREFARDGSPDIEFLKHTLSFVEREYGWKPEIMLFLPPTTPTRTGRDIDRALAFMEKTKADSVRTIIDPSPFNPFKMWTPVGDEPSVLVQLYPPNKSGTPRQFLPRYYLPFGLVYGTRAKFIRKGKIWGPKVRFLLCDRRKFVDIDEPNNLKDAERVMRELKLLE